ncbi:hypothetical protein N7449_009562 [Penicillium cf. viridicatum]|uniref:Uncharacterized protein n=1 Tax=Penicillium cf. viridicatum TaxID=2972119 RepID=A0A9W9M8P5_9EURO|nr:hypothetical protein N7449_009562 [Penicillium cf. viridicatum]
MSMHQNLEDAICLLALISDRPPGLEESTQETEPSDIDRGLESYPNDVEFDDPEDPTVLGADPEHEQYCIELKNQFLDRLAGTLARFKTDAQAKKSNDAKHVSAAMMVCYEDEERVKIFCAKNEGLEQEDEDFLARWKLLMESIARKGYASDEDTSAMFNLVADYQWPRITTYLESLKLSRKWEDDNEFLFTIPLDYSVRKNRPAPADKLTNVKSNTTCTSETVHEIQGSVAQLFENIRRLYQADTHQKTRQVY